MKKACFTENQILGILRGLEAGMPVVELSRKYRVSDAIIYKWCANFDLMTASHEKNRLKYLYAELSLDPEF